MKKYQAHVPGWIKPFLMLASFPGSPTPGFRGLVHITQVDISKFPQVTLLIFGDGCQGETNGGESGSLQNLRERRGNEAGASPDTRLGN